LIIALKALRRKEYEGGGRKMPESRFKGVEYPIEEPS
jgi:hypothetical protein